MKPMLYSAGLLLLLAAHTAADTETTKAPKTAEVWMAVLPADVLVPDGAQGDFVKKHVDGIKFWTQQADSVALPRPPRAPLVRCIRW